MFERKKYRVNFTGCIYPRTFAKYADATAYAKKLWREGIGGIWFEKKNEQGKWALLQNDADA